MRKNVFIALLVIFAVGTSTLLQAQSSGKKKKKKKKTTVQTVNTDSIAAARAMDSLAKLQVVAVADVPPDTALTDNLTADANPLAFLDFPLDSTRPVDGWYKYPLLKGAKPFPFPKQNPNNIVFYKRIWRTIDLTDSVNKIFAVPGESLMQMIMDALKAEKLLAYKDENFKSRLTYNQVVRAFSDSTIVPVLDSLTGEQTGTKTVFNPFNPDSIVKYELKEDVYFDKVRGRLVTQTVGLAPIKKIKLSTGEIFGEEHPFWLYFNQCRAVFAGKDIFDTQRDIYNVSYDDIFITRNFKTQIVKESNPGELRIKDKYPDEEAQKKEAERIEKDIRNHKKNLWKY